MNCRITLGKHTVATFRIYILYKMIRVCILMVTLLYRNLWFWFMVRHKGPARVLPLILPKVVLLIVYDT